MEISNQFFFRIYFWNFFWLYEQFFYLFIFCAVEVGKWFQNEFGFEMFYRLFLTVTLTTIEAVESTILFQTSKILRTLMLLLEILFFKTDIS